MATRSRSAQYSTANGANLGFEAKMWQAADKLRGQADPGEYKRAVLRLVFLPTSGEAS